MSALLESGHGWTSTRVRAGLLEDSAIDEPGNQADLDAGVAELLHRLARDRKHALELAWHAGDATPIGIQINS
jgi:hypothetical protein